MLILVQNGPMPTTAALASVASGTAIKTLLQFKAGATNPLKVIEWGISFDGSTAQTPGKVELIETDVAATVTAFVTADITKFNGEALALGDPTTSLIAVGTAASGYTATVEGSITAVRTGDIQLLPPTGPYVKQFPLGREFVIQAGKFGRIRVTFGTTVNIWCYAIVDI